MATLYGTTVAAYSAPAPSDDGGGWFDSIVGAATDAWDWFTGDGDPMPHDWTDFGPGTLIDLGNWAKEELLPLIEAGGAGADDLASFYTFG